MQNAQVATGGNAAARNNGGEATTAASVKQEAQASAARQRKIQRLKIAIAEVDAEVEEVDGQLRAALWDYIPKFKCKNIHSARRAEIVTEQQQCVALTPWH